jgi:hypothetical protein
VGTPVLGSWGGFSCYRPAPDVLQTLTVVRARQTIAFDEWPGEIFVGESFVPKVTASSKLPVVLEMVGDGSVEISGGKFFNEGWLFK